MSENKITLKEEQDSNGKTSRTAEISGLILHVDKVERWNEIVPGAASQILEMAQKEQSHRMKMNMIGTITGSSIVVLVLILCGYMVYNGNALEGLALVLTPLGILVGSALFVYNKDKSTK